MKTSVRENEQLSNNLKVIFYEKYYYLGKLCFTDIFENYSTDCCAGILEQSTVRGIGTE